MLLIVTEVSVYWDPHCECIECRRIVYCLHKSGTCRKQNKCYGDSPSNTRSLLPSQLHAMCTYPNSIYSSSGGYRDRFNVILLLVTSLYSYLLCRSICSYVAVALVRPETLSICWASLQRHTIYMISMNFRHSAAFLSRNTTRLNYWYEFRKSSVLHVAEYCAQD
jgi:hypothetical protein